MKPSLHNLSMLVAAILLFITIGTHAIEPKLIKVGVYEGYGASINAKRNTRAMLNCEADRKIEYVPITWRNYRRVLTRDQIDVFIMPGGGAKRQWYGLAARHRGGSYAVRRYLRDFVKRGGGFLGICAGAFVGSTRFMRAAPRLSSWTGRRYQIAGRGFGYISEIQYENSEYFAKLQPALINEKETVSSEPLFYANGPIFQRDPYVYSRFDLRRNPMVFSSGAPGSRMVTLKGDNRDMSNKPTAVFNNYGKGAVILSGPHPEAKVGNWINTFPSGEIKSPTDCGSPQANNFLRMVYAVVSREILPEDLVPELTVAEMEEDDPDEGFLE